MEEKTDRKQGRGSESPMEGRCGGRLAHTNPTRYCTSMPIKDRKRCKFHGGMSPRGMEHYKIKAGGDGRFSKYIPKGISEAYERARTDPELLSLNDDLALIQARQVQLLEELKEAKPVPWDSLVKAYERLESALGAIGKSGIAPAREASTALGQILNEGKSAALVQEQVWDQLGDQIDRKNRVALTEHKRIQDLATNMTAEQALMLVNAFLVAGKEYIADQSAYAQFANRVVSYVRQGREQVVIEAKQQTEDANEGSHSTAD